MGLGSVVLSVAQLWNKEQAPGTGRGRCECKASDKKNTQRKEAGHFSSSVIWEMSQGYMIYS